MKLSSLTPDTRNANKGTARGRKLVRESLKRYGAGRSILLDKNGAIIAGNKTAEAAGAVGMEDVQIVKSDGSRLVAVQRTDLDINDKAARELAIADNRASEIGLEWDVDILKQFEHEEVDLSPFWDERELVSFLARPSGEAPEPKLDQAEALRQKWETKRGQIWEIGKHRLMCGDVKDTALPVSTVVLTDPPYNVGKDYGEGTDDSKASSDYMEWTRMWFAAAEQIAETCVLVTIGITNLPMWLADVKRTHRILVWIKENQCSRNYIGETSGFNCWEPLLVYGKAKKCIARDVFSIPISTQADTAGHPCPKSLEAWKWIVENFTDKGDTVADYFHGSGTTMVACEQLKRTCYALEIEPKYVAVALERLSDMGLKPELKHG